MRICLYLAPWVLLIGCSSCAPRVVAMDAATDARDAASDERISPQTCSEAGVNPAFSCPLVASPNAGWRRIGCLPRCGIEIADDPTQS
ncbi:MAG: hypothetical protein Q8Q09_10830, partial [Deltaproteobacteria bacterium]|nr:hypothetical protein [Deltaproteobacteria bacterium]